MKKAILFLSTALLILPDMALSQPQHRPPSGGGSARPPGPSARPSPRPSRPGGSVQPSRPGGGGSVQPSRPGGPNPGRPGGGGPTPSRPGGDGHHGRPPTQPGRPGGPHPGRPGDYRPPHHPGAGRPPNFRPIPGPAFRYPHGYRYRRWTVGLFLPAVFFSSYYYYNDYWRLGLGAPPYGYRWVRYGPDLLLVEVRSRRVVDVVYGAFY
ncbi:RcnB family protein [Sphingobium sp. WTD-1]|uniref:RcnB family protein n=1 Tax=Sphingobium sp. WTD-1 TaxID=2979467 RepID=UPI0024DE5E34|nr:RcnB family protein [Sphingobium sp. WTD-1]WIA54976.1 RcnB family protein [Sphingobium sp. WTD-1]